MYQLPSVNHFTPAACARGSGFPPLDPEQNKVADPNYVKLKEWFGDFVQW